MVSHRITGARCCSPAPICSLCGPCADVLTTAPDVLLSRYDEQAIRINCVPHAAGHTKRCHDRMTKAICVPAKRTDGTSWAKRREQLAHYANDNAYLTTSTGRTGHSLALDTRSCRTEIMPATTDTALKPCAPNLLPAVVVSPPWLSKKKKSRRFRCWI